MKLAGHRSLPFPRQTVWGSLLEPEVLMRALPGCSGLEGTGQGTWTGGFVLQVGSVRGELTGALEAFDLEPLERVRFRLSGQGAAGSVTGEATVRLEEEGLGTLLSFELEVRVSGRLAGQGKRVLDSAARVTARQGLEHLERELGARADAAREAAPGPAPRKIPAIPSFGALTRDFLGELVEETLPPRWRPWVALAGAVLLALFAWAALQLRGR